MPPTTPTPRSLPPWQPVIFIIAGLACMTPWASASIALTVGCIFGLLGLSAFQSHAKLLSRQMIQWSVAALGLLVPIPILLQIVQHGMVFAVGTILIVFASGLLLARLLKIQRDETLLICSGTAICGGSAIAAVGSSIAASSSAMAISTAAVFILNALALYLFPILGHALDLSDTQFGTWAGVAIHDVSSVTGASKNYLATPASTSGLALETATIVKLSRVIWIVPIALIAGWWIRTNDPTHTAATKKLPIPWLIILFIAASASSTLFPAVREHAVEIRKLTALLFQGALFLIGSGISRKALAAVGPRVFILAVALWLLIAAGSLPIILATVQ
jgi:uncharacterized integral membrane protein (TIGR00698 family)